MTAPRSIRSVPLRKWPDIDRRLWLVALEPGRPFRNGGYASGWRAATVESVEQGYGRFLGWLDGQDKLDTTREPIERVTPNIIEAFEAAYAPGRAPLTVAGSIRGIAYVVRATRPPHGLPWLTRLAHFLTNSAEPSRAKLPRMVHVGELVQLGESLVERGMRELCRGHRSGAQVYRDGLMISTLARVPTFRRRNFGGLQLGENLRAIPNGFRVSFDPSETKTKRALKFDLPQELNDPLSVYLERIRPVLLGDEHDEGWLWIGRTGARLQLNEISMRVTRTTQRHLGRRVSPHLFRDIYATDTALWDPKHVGLIKDGLDHTTMATYQRSYNQATAVAATRRLSGLISTLLDDHGK